MQGQKADKPQIVARKMAKFKKGASDKKNHVWFIILIAKPEQAPTGHFNKDFAYMCDDLCNIPTS